MIRSSAASLEQLESFGRCFASSDVGAAILDAVRDLREVLELEAQMRVPRPPAAHVQRSSRAQHASQVRAIQSCVARQFRVSVADILGDSRMARIVKPRMLAMALAREVTAASITELGRLFRHHHTTILNACRRVHQEWEGEFNALLPIVSAILAVRNLPAWSAALYVIAEGRDVA